MPSIPQYLIESGICFALFYCFYRLFLQRTVGYLWNRLYLLITPILALLIPGLSLDFLAEPTFILHGQSPDFDLAALEEFTNRDCLLYTSPSPRDQRGSRMPSSA